MAGKAAQAVSAGQEPHSQLGSSTAEDSRVREYLAVFGSCKRGGRCLRLLNSQACGLRMVLNGLHQTRIYGDALMCATWTAGA